MSMTKVCGRCGQVYWRVNGHDCPKKSSICLSCGRIYRTFRGHRCKVRR